MGSDRQQAPPPGRERELVAIVAALQRGPVVIHGDAGIGKTVLLDAVAERVLADRVVWITAAEGTSDLAFGSLAPVLELDLAGDPAAAVADVVRQLSDRSAGRILVVVDDAHWLDRRSAAAIRTAAERGTPVLLAARRGEPLPADVSALAGQGTALDLGPLPEPALADLARSVLGHPLHPVSLAELLGRSAGNPLFARELLLAAAGDDGIREVDGVIRAALGALPTSLRLLIGQRVTGIAPAPRAVLDLAAISQGLPVDAALALHGAPAVEAAEASGLLVLGPSGRQLHMDHPLFAEALVAEIGAARRARLLGDLVGWAAAQAGSRSCPIDPRQLARWALDARRPVPTDVLVTALRAALAQRDDALALRIADALQDESGLDGQTQLLRVRALHFATRSDAALALLDQLVPRDGDDALIAARGAVEGEVRFWGSGDADGARRAVADAQARIEDLPWWMSLEVARLTYALLGGAPAEVVEGLAGIDAEGPLGYTIASVRIPALVLVGRGADADGPARAVLDRIADPEQERDEPDDAATERTMAEAAAAFALTEAGDLSAAEAVGICALQRGTRLATEPLRCWSALMLGRAASARGELDDARRWFGQVAHARGDDEQGPGPRWGLAGLLLVAALSGDRDSATSRFTELAGLDPGGRRMMEAEVAVALAHGAAIAGDDPQPWLALARTHIERSGSLGLAPAVELAAAALGAPIEPLAEADAPPALFAARAAAASALRAADARRCLTAAEALEAMGARLDAAVVAAAGLRRVPGSRALALTAVRLRRAVPQVRIPLLVSLDRPELTPREHEIARLTAGGLTTAQVALAAGCSIRTVENHLHRTYAKLGIAGRTDLTTALDP